MSIYLTVESSRRVAIGEWFIVGWLCGYFYLHLSCRTHLFITDEVVLGVVLGAILGRTFAWLMRISLRRGFIDRQSYVAQYLAMAFFTIGIASTIGSDDLLAAFAAGRTVFLLASKLLTSLLHIGNAISWDGHFNTQTEDEIFVSVIDLVLNCACFVYIGAWLPFDAFNSPELGITPWRLVVLFIAILALRRIPSILLLYKWIPEIRTWREALFSGHFGMYVYCVSVAFSDRF